MTAVSVVVTTYRRPQRLAACLEGLRRQTRPPDEVIAVAHRSDAPTLEYLAGRQAEWPALRCVPVERDGSVAALNSGLRAARGAIVTSLASALPVGRIQWCGRHVGNHHLGAGEPRDVDALKGANMSFRRLAVLEHGFDDRLRGRGTQMHSELSICLPLRRRGLRLVYGPALVVRHYPAPRPRGDDRVHFDPKVVSETAYSEAVQLLEHFGPLRRLVFGVWSLTVGSIGAPGLVQLVRYALRGDRRAGPRFVAAQRGRFGAWRSYVAR